MYFSALVTWGGAQKGHGAARRRALAQAAVVLRARVGHLGWDTEGLWAMARHAGASYPKLQLYWERALGIWGGAQKGHGAARRTS